MTYILWFSNLFYMIHAAFLFGTLFGSITEDDKFSLDNNTFHIFGLASGWCFLLFRFMYTIETEDLVQFLNTILHLEEGYLSSTN